MYNSRDFLNELENSDHRRYLLLPFQRETKQFVDTFLNKGISIDSIKSLFIYHFGRYTYDDYSVYLGPNEEISDRELFNDLLIGYPNLFTHDLEKEVYYNQFLYFIHLTRRFWLSEFGIPEGIAIIDVDLSVSNVVYSRYEYYDLLDGCQIMVKRLVK